MASNPPTHAGNILQRKFAGLPVWAWGVGALAFAGALFVYLRSRSANASQQQQTPQTAMPVGASSPTVYPFFMGSNSTSAVPADTQTSSKNFGTIVGKGFPWNVVPNTVPLYAIPGSDPSKPLNQQSVSWAPDKTTFTLTGPPVLGQWGSSYGGFYPVIYQGQQYYVSQADTYPQNTITNPINTNMSAAVGG